MLCLAIGCGGESAQSVSQADFDALKAELQAVSDRAAVMEKLLAEVELATQASLVNALQRANQLRASEIQSLDTHLQIVKQDADHAIAKVNRLPADDTDRILATQAMVKKMSHLAWPHRDSVRNALLFERDDSFIELLPKNGATMVRLNCDRDAADISISSPGRSLSFGSGRDETRLTIERDDCRVMVFDELRGLMTRSFDGHSLIQLMPALEGGDSQVPLKNRTSSQLVLRLGDDGPSIELIHGDRKRVITATQDTRSKIEPNGDSQPVDQN